eukprot:TRINITY_DN49266_c0_g1_i4.p1 TRINITY_DN49266_c0_g1~~TRINITY_DN49266_c0_g1_i4.p1  ORF type:complete len:108 (-),score=3.75 TRINITY_DN49266_c0_g1_i4:226-549(-)
MIRRPPRSTLSSSSAASDVYKRQGLEVGTCTISMEPARGDSATQTPVVGTSSAPWCKVSGRTWRCLSSRRPDPLPNPHPDGEQVPRVRESINPVNTDFQSWVLGRLI